jgi:ABC-type multidrug transport system ATPase subunit
MSRSFVNHLPHLARGEPAFPEMAGELVRSIPLRQARLTFGRGASEDVLLRDTTLAPRHAVLEFAGGDYFLADQGTDHGTFVNGKSIERIRLQPGDLIHLGPYLFCFKTGHLLWVRQPASPCLAALNLCQKTENGLQLLDDISLVFQPGEFIGLLGPSGAGKTTLLNALNGYHPAKSGRVFLGGDSLYDNFDRLCQGIGYVPQNDLVHGELTCRQALDYVGRLRLPWLSRDERGRRIEETLDLLDLTERAEVPIARLSGGQRKRASVGVELLCKPAILFLDEPTSGLDPGTEARLMQTLGQLSALGKTIVCTTHIMENVERFDKIAVLTSEGKLAFFGPPREALDYFEVVRFIDLYERLEEKTPRDWQESFRRHPLFRKTRALVHQERRPKPLHQQIQRLPARSVSALGQWHTLTRRATRILSADRRLTLLALLQPVLMGGLMCLVFDQVPVLSFLLVIAALWFGCSLAAQVIVKERPIYRRERMVNLRLLPYLFSKFCPLAFLGVLQCLILLGMATYWKGPLDWNVYLPTFVLSSWNGIAMGLIISAWAANADKATAMVPMVFLPQIILAGVMIPTAEMNKPTLIASQAIVAKWANHALEIAQFEGKTVDAQLLAEDGNLVPMWNLFPDEDLRTDKGRGKFLKDWQGKTIHKLDDLTACYGALGIFLFVELASVLALLRRQDVF